MKGFKVAYHRLQIVVKEFICTEKLKLITLREYLFKWIRVYCRQICGRTGNDYSTTHNKMKVEV